MPTEILQQLLRSRLEELLEDLTLGGVVGLMAGESSILTGRIARRKEKRISPVTPLRRRPLEGMIPVNPPSEPSP